MLERFKQEPVLGDTPADDEPKAGIFTGNPTPTGWTAYVRRLERAAGRDRIIIGMLFGAVLASISLNYFQWTKEKIDLRLVRFGDPADKVTFLYPGQVTGTDREFMVRTTIKDYVIKRETINHVDETDRDNWLRLHTDPGWWKVYLDFINPNNPKNVRAEFAKALSTRDIQVLYVTPTAPGSSNYQAIFVTLDRRNGVLLKRQEWIATMSVSQQGMIYHGQDYEQNPLGIIIGAYSIQPRQEEGKLQ